MTSKEKIRDIKSVINEFYHNEKCEGRLTECARKSWLLFQEYCDDILQDLERLEVLEELGKGQMNYIKEQCSCIENLTQENEKLKKVVDWIKHTFEITLDSKVRISDGIDCIQAFPIDLKTNEVIYELLKEVFENEL